MATGIKKACGTCAGRGCVPELVCGHLELERCPECKGREEATAEDLEGLDAVLERLESMCQQAVTGSKAWTLLTSARDAIQELAWSQVVDLADRDDVLETTEAA